MKRREFVAFSGAGALVSAVPGVSVAGAKEAAASVGSMADQLGKAFICTDADGVQHRMQLAAVHELDGGPRVEQFTLQFKTAGTTQLDGLYWVEAEGQRGEMLSLQSDTQGQASASFSRLLS